jgi:signal transduction histidine kinase
MKYGYMQKTFQNNEYREYNESIKDNQRLKYVFYALILMGLHYLVVILLYITYNFTPSVFLYLTSAACFTYIIFSIALYIKRRNKMFVKITKIVTFVMIYSIQTYRVLSLTFDIEQRNIPIIVRNLYILYTLSFTMMIFFLKFNVWSVAIISFLNLAPPIIMQVFLIDPINNKSHVLDIWMGCFLIITSIIKRLEYGTIFKNLYKNLQMNDKLLKYADSLIDKLPNSFFTISEDKIVYMNETFKEFLISNFFPKDDNYSSSCKTETIFIKDQIFVIDEFAKEFTTGGKFTYLDPEIHALTNKITLLNINSIYSLITYFNKTYIKEDKFYFIGEYEYINSKTKLKNYQQVNFRINNYEGKSWCEILMTDITLSKNQNLISELVHTKEKFLSKIAHEFKTPLIYILSLAEEIQTLANSDKTTAKSKIISEIEKKIYHMHNLSTYTLHLIHDISNYLIQKVNISGDMLSSKINKQQQVKLNYETIKLSEILNFCYGILNSLLTLKKGQTHSIKPLLENDIEIHLKTDGLSLKQIILNFISNSVKFTQKGYILIKSEIIKNECLRLSVEDTGIGIQESDFKNIFVEEKMLETHLNMNYMGSGLGLCISKQVADLLGYKISFSSKYFHGSTFSVDIPIQNEDIRLQNEEQTPFNYRKESLLIFENNPSDRSTETIGEDWKLEIDSKTVECELFATERKKYIKNLKNSSTKTHSQKEIISSFTPPQVECKRRFYHKYILIIDDVEIILNSLEKSLMAVLNLHGIRDVGVIKGCDGVDALKEIVNDQIEHKIVCVFIDENMNYLNGREAINIIRQMESAGRINKQYICKFSSELWQDTSADLNVSKRISHLELSNILKNIKLIV